MSHDEFIAGFLTVVIVIAIIAGLVFLADGEEMPMTINYGTMATVNAVVHGYMNRQ